MDLPPFSNLVAYSAQVAAIAAGGTLLLAVLRVHAPSVRYGYWRALLGLCLVLPWVQSRQPSAPMVSATTATAIGPSVGEATAGVVAATAAAESIDPLAGVAVVLIGGALLRLIWIGGSLFRLRRLRTAGERAPASADDDELQRTLGTRAEIRYLPELGQPVTFGVRAPVVLLPDSLRTHPTEIRRAVLCHELLHVQRRDWAWVLVEETVRAAFWFHPAMWWIVSRAQLAREEAVDELAILATRSRRTYIEALLAFADGTPLAAAPAFLRRRHLFRRILLISKETVMSPRRVAISCLVMAGAMVAGSWYAVRAFPLRAAAQEVPAPQQAPADPAAAGDPLPLRLHVVITVEGREPGGTATGDGGSISRPDRQRLVAGGSAATGTASVSAQTVGSPTQSPTPSAPAQGAAGQVTATPPRSANPAPVRVVTAPRKIKDVKPAYPQAAQAANVQGIVILETLIDTSGRVESARVIRSVPILDDAALEAVRQWEFTPTLLNGVPTPILMTVTVNFTMTSEGQAPATTAPVAQPVTGQPAVQPVAGQPAVQPVAGQPAAQPVAGQPAAQPVAGQPAVPLVDGRMPVRVGGSIRAPTKIKDVRPVYPAIARAAKVSGIVIVEATIDQNGHVAGARVIRSIPLLDDAALGAVRQWEFTPTLLGGVPTPIVMSVTVNFTLASEQTTAAASGTPAPALDGQTPIRVGGIAAPRKIRDMRPVYPAEAIEERVTGIVIIEATIGTDGRVAGARVLRSIPLLDDAALTAVRQWQFTPTLLNGVPTPVVMSVTVPFTGAQR